MEDNLDRLKTAYATICSMENRGDLNGNCNGVEVVKNILANDIAAYITFKNNDL